VSGPNENLYLRMVGRSISFKLCHILDVVVQEIDPWITRPSTPLRECYPFRSTALTLQYTPVDIVL
jgi:hypothetical protein